MPVEPPKPSKKRKGPGRPCKSDSVSPQKKSKAAKNEEKEEATEGERELKEQRRVVDSDTEDDDEVLCLPAASKKERTRRTPSSKRPKATGTVSKPAKSVKPAVAAAGSKAELVSRVYDEERSFRKAWDEETESFGLPAPRDAEVATEGLYAGQRLPAGIALPCELDSNGRPLPPSALYKSRHVGLSGLPYAEDESEDAGTRLRVRVARMLPMGEGARQLATKTPFRLPYAAYYEHRKTFLMDELRAAKQHGLRPTPFRFITKNNYKVRSFCLIQSN